MTNTGYWLMDVMYNDERVHTELFKEITLGLHDEIRSISAYTDYWHEWRTVSSGAIAEHRTRLWSLPNHYAVPIKIKPITMDQLKIICPEEYSKEVIKRIVSKLDLKKTLKDIQYEMEFRNAFPFINIEGVE